MNITLATLSQATEQQVFDHVATHLLTQNCKSRCESDDNCMYRGEHNLKCAAGCLIADDEYNIFLENNTWNILVRENRAPNVHRHLISALQNIHDNQPVEEWYSFLENLAFTYNLNTTAIQLYQSNN